MELEEPVLDAEAGEGSHWSTWTPGAGCGSSFSSGATSREASVSSFTTSPDPTARPGLEVEGAKGALPTRGLCVQVKNLTYKITKRTRAGKEEKVILDGVNAVGIPGQILAVAGPSGAGKSMFLDALGGRIRRQSLQGEVLVNGAPADKNFEKCTGYVQQDDLHFPQLTVRETLCYSARLRLPGTMTSAEKMRRVEALLTQLGLEECADVIVGNAEIRGISGGQRRRVSIGVELVHQPGVLLLDEPTSGLDSFAAASVIQILHELAEGEGRTVLLTIHQPSFRILGLIHRFLILARGQAVFSGDYSDLVRQFQGVHEGGVIPGQGNALECALDVLESASAQGSLTKIADVQLEMDRGCFEAGYAALEQHPRKFANSFWSELCILGERALRNTVRTKELFLVRLVSFLISGFIAGSVFYGSGHDMKGLNNRLAFFAFVLAAVFFTSTDGLPIFMEERQIYIREASRGAYRTVSYVIANALVCLPFLMVLAVAFSVVPYFMIGMAPTASAFLFFTATMFLCFAVANSFVLFIASVVPNSTVGCSVHTSLAGVLYLFSGYFIRSDDIPKYWIWLNYISTFKYPLQLFILNEFQSDEGICWADSAAERGACIMTSEAVMESWEVSSARKWVDVLVMVCFFVGYRVLFYIMLKLLCTGVRR